MSIHKPGLFGENPSRDSIGISIETANIGKMPALNVRILATATFQEGLSPFGVDSEEFSNDTGIGYIPADFRNQDELAKHVLVFKHAQEKLADLFPQKSVLDLWIRCSITISYDDEFTLDRGDGKRRQSVITFGGKFRDDDLILVNRSSLIK